MLSKAGETATFYAQGGIAVVLPDSFHDDGDSVDAHVADTLAAGGGLCDPDAVRSIVADGYRAVRRTGRRRRAFRRSRRPDSGR